MRIGDFPQWEWHNSPLIYIERRSMIKLFGMEESRIYVRYMVVKQKKIMED